MIAAGSQLRAQYDQYDKNLNSDPCAYSQTVYYDDPLGRVKEVSSPGKDFEINGGHTTRYWYLGVETDDFLTIPATDGDVYLDNLQNITANGNNMYFLNVVKGPQGNYTQEIKDLLGRTIKTLSLTDGQRIEAQYEYDILGNLLKEIPPHNINNPLDTTKYEYNTLGQMIKKTTPDAGMVEYYYNNAGQLDSVISAKNRIKGERIEYKYDALGRLVFVTTKDGADTLSINIYDNTDNLAQKTEKWDISERDLSALVNLRGRLAAKISIDQFTGNEVIDLY